MQREGQSQGPIVRVVSRRKEPSPTPWVAKLDLPPGWVEVPPAWKPKPRLRTRDPYLVAARKLVKSGAVATRLTIAHGMEESGEIMPPVLPGVAVLLSAAAPDGARTVASMAFARCRGGEQVLARISVDVVEESEADPTPWRD